VAWRVANVRCSALQKSVGRLIFFVFSFFFKYKTDLLSCVSTLNESFSHQREAEKNEFYHSADVIWGDQ